MRGSLHNTVWTTNTMNEQLTLSDWGTVTFSFILLWPIQLVIGLLVGLFHKMICFFFRQTVFSDLEQQGYWLSQTWFRF